MLEEIKLRSWRTSEEAGATEEDIKPSIDKIEVGKMHAAINLGRYQEEMRRWKNKKVKPRNIKEGDLVLWRIPNAKQKGKMHSKVGRPIHRRIHGKAGSLQAPHVGRHRRPIFMEQGHALEVLCLENV